MVEHGGGIRVSDLAERFGVGVMTIRRDLSALEAQGLVLRTHGGVLPREESAAAEVPYQRKTSLRPDEKRRIGAAAAAMIRTGDTIILDSGSTTIQVAVHLPPAADLTVVTNDLKIMMELSGKPRVTAIGTGGILHRPVFTLNGPQTEAALRSIHVDALFLGADAVDLTAGLTNRSLHEVPVKQAMIASARHVVLVCDSSKFGRRVFASVCPVSAIHTIITDRGLDPDMVRALQDRGISVELT
jgi:DeoR family transcriptional regulator, aga operon transcriptional repressor